MISSGKMGWSSIYLLTNIWFELDWRQDWINLICLASSASITRVLRFLIESISLTSFFFHEDIVLESCPTPNMGSMSSIPAAVFLLFWTRVGRDMSRIVPTSPLPTCLAFLISALFLCSMDWNVFVLIQNVQSRKQKKFESQLSKLAEDEQRADDRWIALPAS